MLDRADIEYIFYFIDSGEICMFLVKTKVKLIIREMVSLVTDTINIFTACFG